MTPHLDDTVDGHSLDELSDYLDRGRQPPDLSIDESPECQVALTSLQRLRDVSTASLALDVARQPQVDESWLRGVLSGIAREARAGRDIPLASKPATSLAITEGAVRGVLRAAGERVDGVVIGRCRLDGDVTRPGAPVVVRIDASVLWGLRIPEVAELVRRAVAQDLMRHTELVIASIDVTVHDVHGHPAARGESG